MAGADRVVRRLADRGRDVIRVVAGKLPGLLVIEPDVHRDARGFLVETFREEQFATAGLPTTFAQVNQSRSGRNTVRGLHFQVGVGQAKLVRVSRGRILDVVVDLRRSSPTLGRHAAIDLDDVDHCQLFIPVGFAHGFAVLSDEADVCYRLSNPYDATQERGLAWDDPELGIDWHVAEPVISDRDHHNPTMAEIRDQLPDW